MEVLKSSAVCYVRKNSSATFRLICFSYAGGSAGVYQHYHNLLHPCLEIVAIQLPGRASRLRDKLLKDWSEMRAFIQKELASLSNMPYILFGHSFGTRLVSEYAKHQSELGNPPQHMFCSGARALHIRNGLPPIHQLCDDEFLEKLVQMGGTPSEVVENKQLMSLLIPMLRADFSLSHSHSFPVARHFDCPATIIYGDKDERTTYETVQAWQVYFSKIIKTRCIEGEHFYINENKDAVAREINQVVESLLMETIK
ncbi:thioesterase II family protein [Vibrio parahaemolyticus]|uniref:thioesterase II family protein n=1 Tax=Vibrio parahaemolyticus TaxID=670 RepID=UPI001D8829B7|nr:thioesterase domain-containing protein [Vibrio parahaemolyticus]EGR2301708.1 thioesterase [Vibrio parahaemolyticus]EHH1258767.1 thioesterase [Vibrio parahaemolyticus]EJG1722876.1 thioesterase [Vibrio parahaemolyticus]EJG1736522.1 thioesterase [Vibrio parahaemolyticus]EJG1750364.1 thioesterase [Vibrio parahaemolyticus]